VDTELSAKDLLNSRMAYVSVSRGQWDAQIFTNDRSALANALGHDVSHQSALRNKQVATPAQQLDQSKMQKPAHDFGLGIDMGF
jgi:hypothetical protein